ncbi:TIR domain-containing protein [Rheinheimera gaetbuli]
MEANQHPGALREAQRLIQEALDTGATHLNLSKLRLRQLPKELVLLAKQLTSLDLSDCRELTNLSGLEPFTQLTQLNLGHCEALQSLDGLLHLPQLTRLDISCCYALQALDALQYLTQLTHLDISHCDFLTNLDALEHLAQLAQLNISYCYALNSIVDLQHLTQLTQLTIRSCRGLPSLDGLQHLSQLNHIDFRDNKALQSLDELQHLTLLSRLNISGCDAIESLDVLQQLTQLTQLDLSFCVALKSLDVIQRLTQLTKLDLSFCVALKSLDGMQRLTLLSQLGISHCNFLTNLDVLRHLPQLSKLDVTGCKALQSLDGLQYLTQLTQLNISNCSALRGLDELQHLTKLTQLIIGGSDALRHLGVLQHLSQLTQLDISYCRALRSLDGLQYLTQLTHLDISFCPALNSLHELQYLTQLTQLNISGSAVVQSLVALQNLTQLTSLDVKDSSALNSLDGLQHLTQLMSLNISDCSGLKSLYGMQHLPQLVELRARDCSIEKLGPLQDVNKEFPYLTTLYLDGNPLQKHYNLQLNEAENSLPILEAFLYQQGTQQTETQIRLPAKVMLLGNHAAGKTSLLCHLDSKLKHSGTTHILQVHPYAVASHQKQSKQKSMLPDAMVYDFGGQDYYHGIYRVFMGQDGIRCLVWNKQQDLNQCLQDSNNEENLLFSRAYWLGCIRHFQPDGASAQLLMVQTYIDRDDAELTASDQICSQHHLSLKMANNKSRTAALANSVLQLEQNLHQAALAYFKAQLDKVIYEHQATVEQAVWYETFLAKILATHNTNELSEFYQATDTKVLLDLYRAPGAELASHQLLETALTQLHRQGLVLYYPSINPQKVWQNPMAFVEYVHSKVLAKHHLQQAKGIVAKSVFDKMQVDADVLAILLQEKVIFLHENGGGDAKQPEYIVPNYLPLTNENNPDYQFATFGLLTNPALTLWFEHYLPLGLINQLVCFFGRMPDRKKFWRDQILFMFETSSRVLIKLAFSPKLQIQVFLQNDDAQQYQQHLSYLYYVLMALYNDCSVDTYADFCQKRQKLQGHYLPPTGLGEAFADEQPLTPELPALYHKIYFNPPADLRLSVNGQHFVKAIGLARLPEQQTTVVAQDCDTFEPAAQLPASLFAAFMLNKPKKRLKVFISYAHDDIEQRHVLNKFLIPLVRIEQIEIWHDNMINAGDFWDKTIRQKLAEADVAILLVSQSLLASSYIQDVEAPLLMQLHQQQKLSIIPVLIRDCCYEDWLVFPSGSNPELATSAAQLQFLPKNEQTQLQAIQDWRNPEKAWKQVVEELTLLFKQG